MRNHYTEEKLIEEIYKYTTDEIVELILMKYHSKTRIILKQIEWLIKKLEKSLNYKIKKAELKWIKKKFATLQIEISEHMSKEENLLFPQIKNGNGQLAYWTISTIQEEHVCHCLLIDQLIKVADEMSSECIFCNLIKSTLRRFDQLNSEHVFIEDHILTRKLLIGE